LTKIRLTAILLLPAVLLAACASGTATVVPALPDVAEPSAPPILTATGEPAPALDPTAAPSSDVQPMATSRGPDLHASDPATVSLASGGLQLVEFFRFT
jgi:hypothetical protein